MVTVPGLSVGPDSPASCAGVSAKVWLAPAVKVRFKPEVLMKV